LSRGTSITANDSPGFDIFLGRAQRTADLYLRVETVGICGKTTSAADVGFPNAPSQGCLSRGEETNAFAGTAKAAGFDHRHNARAIVTDENEPKALRCWITRTSALSSLAGGAVIVPAG